MEPNENSQAVPPLIPTDSDVEPGIQSEDLIDWDFQLEVDTSQRRSGVVKAKVHYVGRAVPIPLSAPGELESP